jgi:hypothetical protein
MLNKSPEGLPRKDFRQALRRTANNSPFMTEKEGLEVEKLFSSKFGSHISESDVNKTLLELRREKYQVKGLENKIKIGRQIKLLENLKSNKKSV